MPVQRKAPLMLTLLLVGLATACARLPAALPPTATPAPSLPRWKLWERALGDILNGPPENTRPDLSQDHGICEWEIWGQKGNDVYVWALCKVYHTGIGTTATSAPAIVRLGAGDQIQAVILPAEGWGNIGSLFPDDVLQKIHNQDFDVEKTEMDIALRSGNPALPPLIIQKGEILP
jgi:hypothetical protein